MSQSAIDAAQHHQTEVAASCTKTISSYNEPVIGFMSVRQEAINDDFMSFLAEDFLRFVDNGCKRVDTEDSRTMRSNILTASVI